MLSFRPKASPHHLERSRLLDSLPDEAGFVVWLQAPYGYGKTVLASQWADLLELSGWRVIWLAVGGRDPKPLLASQLGLPESAPWGVLLEALWGQLTLLVIEDLETLHEHESLSPLLKEVRGLVLLASRTPLSSSELPRLVTAGKLVHVTSETLVFSEQEAEELYGDAGRANDVWRRTQGWPLPLHFALLTGKMPERAGLLGGMKGSLRPAEWDEALLLASVAQLPTAAANGATESLAVSGFALLTEGGYRLHSLVANTILRAHEAAAKAVLKREQARLSLVERAEAFERCGDQHGLQEALEEVEGQLWRQAPENVLRWDALLKEPASALRHITVGGALKVLGRYEESAERLEAALAAGGLTPDEELIALGELCWVQAVTAPELAVQTVERGEALLSCVHPERAGRFLSNSCIVDVMASRFDEAITKLERALSHFPEGSQYRAGARINLALSRWDQRGEFDSRLATQIETLPDVWRLYPSDAPGQCRDVAMLHGWLGNTAEQRSYFEQAGSGARNNPLVGLEVEAATARLDGDTEPFLRLLTKAEAWGDAYTQEVITMHGVNALSEEAVSETPEDALAARRFFERSPAKGGLAAAAYALVLNAEGAQGEALALLDENLRAYPDRARQLYLRGARYRITRSENDLEKFMALTTSGARLLPGFVPLTELPRERPELSLPYPLKEVAASGWREAVQLRANELPELQLTLLGEVKVQLFGEQLRLTERLQQLTALLTLGLSREQTAEAMWPGTSVDKQRNNLGVQLSLLRKLIEPWGFSVYVVDDRLQRTTSDHADLNRALAQRDANAALSIFEEPFAPGLSLEPVEDERRRLREEVVALLLEAGLNSSGERAASFLTRVLELDPLNEQALQGFLKLLLKVGRRQEASRRYEAFRHRLHEEMGLKPLAETAALLELVG